MAARQRSSVDPSKSSESTMTYSQFMELFPDNTACVEYLKARFYPDGCECPKCGKATKFHPVAGRAAYACQYCRGQVYPTAGTIFHKSSTSLQLWFWAIFLMSSTRCGISAKQLEREIGVSYPTAHRMFKQIRTLLEDDGDPLTGEIEMDEMFVGGKPRASDRAKWTKHPVTGTYRQAALRWADETKVPVFGMVERGGRVVARVVPDITGATLEAHVAARVLPAALVFTDEAPAYVGITARRGYEHRRIHHKAGVYVQGTTHTNTIEGFWSLCKNGIRGVYHSVSAEYLQTYLNEYAFRYNARNSDMPMFWLMLDRVQKVA